jgi:hypothetical protein
MKYPFIRHYIATFSFKCALQTNNKIYIHEHLIEQKMVGGKKKGGGGRE